MFLFGHSELENNWSKSKQTLLNSVWLNEIHPIYIYSIYIKSV